MLRPSVCRGYIWVMSKSGLCLHPVGVGGYGLSRGRLLVCVCVGGIISFRVCRCRVPWPHIVCAVACDVYTLPQYPGSAQVVFYILAICDTYGNLDNV